MTSHTTRRAILIGATAIPIAAVAANLPAAADDSNFERLAAELAAAHDQHRSMCDALGIADKAFTAWKKRNPKPEMRKCTVGTNADLKAAIAEHQTAMRGWNKRKAAAQTRCGYDAAKAAEVAACDEVSRLIDKLSLMPALSMRGLRTKAALAEKFSDADLAWSVVDDLNAVPGASAA